MKIEQVTPQLSVSAQVGADDIQALSQRGVEVLICNRPDGEVDDQIGFDDLASLAKSNGIDAISIAFKPGAQSTEQTANFAKVLEEGKQVHAFCRTGTRSKSIYAATLEPSKTRIFDVAVIGGGSGGLAVVSSLLKRKPDLSIAVIEPSADHYYQPGWTMVGGGVFDAKSTHRLTKDLIPAGVTWLRDRVSSFLPSANKVLLAGGAAVAYQHLVVAPGLLLNWSAIEGLESALGNNGVTSNYRYDLAPYTWDLVQNLQQGRAIFTQPPMPIKCAGAPQKALYLSASEWRRRSKLGGINIDFYNAGPVLFGVPDYVPALQEYIDLYGAKVHYSHNLVSVDGANKTAIFSAADADGKQVSHETKFDMLHVCPPQIAPEFIRNSELSDAAGWLDVDPETLDHKAHKNVWGVGDVMNTSNAKTMAAARKQAPVVAENICNTLEGAEHRVHYDGYGSCPLTVEHGKIVLAEFLYGGKVAPTFPSFINDGTRPSRFAWHLKAKVLPSVYWQAMLKGREWLASSK